MKYINYLHSIFIMFTVINLYNNKDSHVYLLCDILDDT